mmetsp:Transcript_36399/g.77430  ORF Transcript_36399/g.77430 Transcript_36399/m.77430 type:complete len:332 (-) Transcript_36399:17-1012(-)
MANHGLFLAVPLLALFIKPSLSQGLPALPSGVKNPFGDEGNPFASGAQPFPPSDDGDDTAPAPSETESTASLTLPPIAQFPTTASPLAPLPADETLPSPAGFPTLAPTVTTAAVTVTTTLPPTTTTVTWTETTTTTDLEFLAKVAGEAAFSTSDPADEKHLMVIGHLRHLTRSSFPWRGVTMAVSYVVIAIGLLLCFSATPATKAQRKQSKENKKNNKRTRAVELENFPKTPQNSPASAGATSPYGSAVREQEEQQQQQRQHLLLEPQPQYQLPPQYAQQQPLQLQSQQLYQQQQPVQFLQEPIATRQLAGSSWHYSIVRQAAVESARNFP